MAIEKYDYYNEFMDEGKPFYNSLNELDEDKFNDWVADNFIEVDTIESFEEVKPSRNIFDKIVKGYRHINGQCHYSAKAVCLLDAEFKYFTGFIQRRDSYLPIVTHSFNVYQGSIIDFSRLKDDFSMIQEKKSTLPHVYFGINIPTEFVARFSKDVFEERSMNPLLYEWFREQNVSLE